MKMKAPHQACIQAVSVMSLFEQGLIFWILQVAGVKSQSVVRSAKGSLQGPGKDSGLKTPETF